MFLSDADKKIVEKLVSSGVRLCAHCLGRLFGKVGSGLSNPQRASKIIAETAYEYVEPAQCNLCQGIFGKIDRYAEIGINVLKNVEWETFLVGSKYDEEILAYEEKLWLELGARNAESIKSEFNREVGKKIAEISGKSVNFTEPDCVVIIDTRFDVAQLEIRPLFIYGRYRKYVRGIPQTRWYCRNCRGKGCRRCGGTGKMYETSVQELIACKVIEATGGKEHFFHGMGREDIDVRMLGNGRPFILEIREPVKRKLDLAKLAEEINEYAREMVEVEGLRFATHKDVESLKSEKATKRYIALVEFDQPVSPERFERVLCELREKDIYQKTPYRVLHRRSDLTRKRRIHDAKLNWLHGNTAELEIECASGTYVKELVSGDEGRTTPSISELLGIPCRVKALDVIKINDGLEE
ncbi:MAG: tRNA pseudouridine(54/55) synthase Pus10 [Thermoplasmata archaeon]